MHRPHKHGRSLLTLSVFARMCHRSTVWLGNSVVRVHARYARGSRFESWSDHMLFPRLWHLWLVWVHARAASSEWGCLVGSGMVPSRFRDRSNLAVGNCHRLVAQWSECSHCMQEVLCLSPGRAMCFFNPATQKVAGYYVISLSVRCPSIRQCFVSGF